MALELNKIHNENCLETMARMPEKIIDLTITSPPYDDLKGYKGYSFEFESIVKELYRVTKEGGVIVWVVGDATIKGNETGTSFKQALYFKECGFKLHDTMIWYKPNSFNFGSNACYRQSFEYMFIFSKGNIITPNLIKDVPTKMRGKVVKGARKHANGIRDKVPDFVIGDNKKRDNVWLINVATRNYNHPAIFPEVLANDHILSWSNVDDLIYDPMMGSGTVAKMALVNHRKFIGSEISKEYCDEANKRIQSLLLQKHLDI
ncbi:MAG: site-specific DNA-methyltransferase [Dehalococcoidales bacterium]|nr:site-specific DNA-methyltransferase [Dehalococcoidales bacterium]